MKRAREIAFRCMFAVALVASVRASARAQASPADRERRIESLLARLTTAQKLTLMHGGEPGPFAGRVPGVPEIGIPPLALEDGPAGVRDGSSIALPAPIALAASWDPSLATAYGDVLGRDAIGKGANGLLGPSLDLARVYANGRTFEAFGEDPWLASALAVPEIRAIQARHVVAVIKHYIANVEQNGQHRDSSVVDARALHELYLAPFAAAVEDGDAGGVMCAYNRIGADWSCENARTLGILDRELGFDGFVVSDWYAQHDVFKSLSNGLDLEMPKGIVYGAYLTGAVARGNARIATIDGHVRRILRGMSKAGLLDPVPAIAAARGDAAADLAVARTVADAGAVMLKNDGTLPFDRAHLRSLAVIGPSSLPAVVAGGGSSLVSFDPSSAPSIAQAIRTVASGIDVSFADAGGPPFAEDAPTVDSLALSPSSGSGPGLLGSYYANRDLGGTPSFTRIDPSVWFQWGTSPPIAGLPLASSVRWTGTLHPSLTGTYRIGGDYACGCRLRIGDTVVQDAWDSAPGAASSLGTIDLRAGVAYPVVFDWRFGGDSDVRLAWRPPVRGIGPDIARAVAVARRADAAVVFVGDFSTEGRDRPSLRLGGDQEALIEAVAAVNPRTVVVLESGGPVVVTPWIDRVAALVELWYPGEAGGLAAADVLFGSVDPSGRLPFTFPASEDDVPAAVAYAADPPEGPSRPIVFAEGLDVGYRWYDAHARAPAYPFGFGLSYTRFTCANLTVTKRDTVPAGFDVEADVTNAGTRAGAFVLQAYVAFPSAAAEPPRVLRGATKTALAPGETKRVSIALPRIAFAIWDARTRAMRAFPGTYSVGVGSSSRDLPLQATIHVDE